MQPWWLGHESPVAGAAAAPLAAVLAGSAACCRSVYRLATLPVPRLLCPACALQVKGRLSDLQAERQAHPDMQDDEALKEAALQVGATGLSVHSMAQLEQPALHARTRRLGGQDPAYPATPARQQHCSFALPATPPPPPLRPCHLSARRWSSSGR